MADWYVQKGPQRVGPISQEVLTNMIQAGQVAPSDLVWTEGMATWQSASAVPAIAGFFPAGASTFPPPLAGGPPPLAQGPGAGVSIPNYLPWAIAATLLCCLPAGIASIIYANKANTEKAHGDIVAAQASANNAKIWLIVSVAVGFVATLFFIIVAAAGEL